MKLIKKHEEFWVLISLSDCLFPSMAACAKAQEDSSVKEVLWSWTQTCEIQGFSLVMVRKSVSCQFNKLLSVCGDSVVSGQIRDSAAEIIIINCLHFFTWSKVFLGATWNVFAPWLKLSLIWLICLIKCITWYKRRKTMSQYVFNLANLFCG